MIYIKKKKNIEMVKQKKRTRITQLGKNCAIQGASLIWKLKDLIGSDQTLSFISHP